MHKAAKECAGASEYEHYHLYHFIDDKVVR